MRDPQTAAVLLTPDHRGFAEPLVEWDVAKGFALDFAVFQAEHDLARREVARLRVVISHTTKSAIVAAGGVLPGAASLGLRGCRGSQWRGSRQAIACQSASSVTTSRIRLT